MRPFLLLLPLLLAACSAAPSSGDFVSSAPASENLPSDSASQRAASAEALTPYSSLMTYPSNWAQITRRRQ